MGEMKFSVGFGSAAVDLSLPEEKIIDEMGGDTPEPVETDPVYLEVSRDNLKGTAENDLFVADVAQKTV